MIRFILNNKTVETNEPAGLTLLDFIRYHKNLVGTKIGCREGDCGACTILVGELVDGELTYKSMTSCITPLGNANGKHIVSIEGLNLPNSELNTCQEAMVKNGGTQCGFCTPGFVVSLGGYGLTTTNPSKESAIGAIDGNICRCTGYKSIERAADEVAGKLSNLDMSNRIEWLVEHKFIPAYFTGIKDRLAVLESFQNELVESKKLFVGGGTDLFVQKHDEVYESEVDMMFSKNALKGISIENGVCKIGASATASDLMLSKEFNQVSPNMYRYLKLVSSTPIRNMGSVAGNFVNASPIGDLTAIFLALNANITLINENGSKRELPLKDFYLGYKKLDKTDEEHINEISFNVPSANTQFNFEKVSKRTYLDIASVNTAISITVDGDIITDANISAGGVGPTPIYLAKTGAFLIGKEISNETIEKAAEIVQQEISPISDVRGSETYKRTLLNQLFKAHFLELFPQKINQQELIIH